MRLFYSCTEAAEIHIDVNTQDTEQLSSKQLSQQLRGTELLDYLTSLTVTDLVYLRHADTYVCRGYHQSGKRLWAFNCVVIGDACATKDLENNHRKSEGRADVQTSFCQP
jgi:hypothetical protein